jgi:hypothetical protein
VVAFIHIYSQCVVIMVAFIHNYSQCVVIMVAFIHNYSQCVVIMVAFICIYSQCVVIMVAFICIYSQCVVIMVAFIHNYSQCVVIMVAFIHKMCWQISFYIFADKFLKRKRVCIIVFYLIFVMFSFYLFVKLFENKIKKQPNWEQTDTHPLTHFCRQISEMLKGVWWVPFWPDTTFCRRC